MVEHDKPGCPLNEIGRTYQRESIAYTSRRTNGQCFPGQRRIYERPIELRDWIETNRELLSPTGKLHEPIQLQICTCQPQNRSMLLIIDAQNIHDRSIRSNN